MELKLLSRYRRIESEKPVNFDDEIVPGIRKETSYINTKKVMDLEETTIEEISKYTNDSIRTIVDVRKCVLEVSDAI